MNSRGWTGIAMVPALLPPLTVSSCAPRERPSREVRAVDLAAAQQAYPPISHLRGLVSGSSVIMIGRVDRIVREDPVPANAPNALSRCTVYELRVDRYLKSDSQPQQPPTLKVFMNGGLAPNGRLQAFEDFPFLNVGSRYLLFLKEANRQPIGPNGESLAGGTGLMGPEVYADELVFSDEARGKILIKDGRTQIPEDLYGQNLRPWTFERGGPQILGCTEAEAIDRVEQAMRSS